MAINIDFKADIKEATRHLNRVQRKVIPKVTARALNETASNHRNKGAVAVAKQLKLPQKNLKFRLDKNGNKKGNRATIQKANKQNLTAEINVHARGIPVIQVVSRAQKVRSAIRARKGGIKAAGGRVYKRAFIAEAKGGNVQVFVRRGKTRYPLGVPKIGVRQALEKAYKAALDKTGAKVFRERFARLLNRELERIK